MSEWTIQSLMDWSVDYLRKHQIDEPKRTTELLLAHVLSLSRVQLFTQYDRPLFAEELAAYKELFKRRLKHEPIQYILGTQEFWSMSLEVSPDVLIPRPETECLVEELLCLLGCKDATQPLPLKLLDLCTGSGAVACALASEFEAAEIWAVDVCAKALAMAKSNLDRHGFGERTRCMEGDLFAVLSTQEQRCFDAIVSNPPYISESDWTTLQPEVRDFEPSMALRAGPQGLNLIQSIVKQAPTWLKPEGWLLMEIGSTQGAEVLALAETCQEWGKSWIGKDYAQLDRFLVAQAHR